MNSTIRAVTTGLVLSINGLALAQNPDANPLYGSVSLTAGFLPDPHTVAVTPGGADGVDHLGLYCYGYITAEQPDYAVEYEAGNEQLGIFVHSDIDTTLVISDPRGNWHCNDDSLSLEASNPGILFNTPITGRYNIWVGTYIENDSSDSTVLAITEFEEGEWLALGVGEPAAPVAGSIDPGSINFGDDSSMWSNDGECDDPRFQGPGTAAVLMEEDRLHDASDCRDLFTSGQISLVTDSGSGTGNTGGVDFGDNSSPWSDDGECDDPRFQGEGMASYLADSDLYHDANDCRSLFAAGSITLIDDSTEVAQGDIIRGNLAFGDITREGGPYVDSYIFNANAGETATVDLRSGDFDTYLIVRSPSGEESVNDDYDSSFDRSLLSLNLEETGNYEVLVSSYDAGESGGYTLEIAIDTPVVTANNQLFTGSLESGDPAYSDGEFYDSFPFQGRPGQTVTIDLRSDDFDTYLVLRAPNGETEANDDADSTAHSQIVAQLSERGVYEVFVTSYGAAETGDYELTISRNPSAASNDISSRDVISLAVGDNVQGFLEDGDGLSSEDAYQDSYVFSGQEGQSVIVEMTSSMVDTYLTLVTPSGEEIANDDYNGNVEQSLLQLELPETGRYRVIASSYSSAETGPYRVSVRSGGILAPSGLVPRSGEQIFGIFAGIADYEGEDSDLPLTDQDAIRARDALINGAGMNPDNAYTLLNSDATLANLQAAMDAIAAAADDNDTLVIFYSGHGGRVPRPDGPDSRDPDGMDETMVLYDYDLLDDELATMLDALDIGKVLLVMDSCFSGGFSKDVVSVPGRMGLFSSEEDVLSQVALKFQAGGYLSVFFEEALTQRYADRDDNGEITAIELSQYLHDRFRADVKSGFGTDEYVRASGPQANYQRLVVDRGGIGPYNVLFRRQL